MSEKSALSEIYVHPRLACCLMGCWSGQIYYSNNKAKSNSWGWYI